MLHVCCGPCAIYPLQELIKKNIEIEGLFYNPNIHPKAEYDQRLLNAQIYFDSLNIPLHFTEDFRQEVWEDYRGNKENRCQMCYTLRFEYLVHYAKEHGFDAFTTSLLVSPYQQHDLIKDICERLSKKYDITFYYQDFRMGFRNGQEIAKINGLYRQKYCGCILSYQETKKNVN